MQSIHPTCCSFFPSLSSHKVRAAAEKLVHELDEYYGGKDRASAMLAGSWQAQWMLGEDFEFLDGGGMRGDGAVETRRRRGPRRARSSSIPTT